LVNLKSMDAKEALEYSEKVFLEYSKRKKLTQEKRKKKAEFFKNILLNPKIKNNKVKWVDRYGNASVLDGYFNEEKFFEIKKGMVLYSLKIVSEKIPSQKKNTSSTNVFSLQKKSNEILDLVLKKTKT